MMARTVRLREVEKVAGPVELDHASPLPLYRQIKQHLLDRIAVWPSHEAQFYTDGELCLMFGVSRMTARQAVQELVEEGFLKRRRGAGTFVAARTAARHLLPSDELGRQWGGGGKAMQIEVLAFEIQPCPETIAVALGLPPGTPVRYIRRLRHAGNVPLVLDHRYLPLAVAEQAMPHGSSRSILHAIWQHYDLDRGEMAIEAATAGPDEERWLQVAAGDPLIVRRLRYLTCAGEPVMAGHSFYRADLVRYSIDVPLSREGRESPEPAVQREEYDHLVRLRRQSRSGIEDA